MTHKESPCTAHSTCSMRVSLESRYGNVGFALREGIDHIAQRQQPHVDIDALLQPRSLCLGPFLPLTACIDIPAILYCDMYIRGICT